MMMTEIWIDIARICVDNASIRFLFGNTLIMRV